MNLPGAENTKDLHTALTVKKKKAMTDAEKNVTEFEIFCIENVAQKLGIAGNEAYNLLSEKSHILDEYIIPNYEVLHTQSKDYIVNDIIECMVQHGVWRK